MSLTMCYFVYFYVCNFPTNEKKNIMIIMRE